MNIQRMWFWFAFLPAIVVVDGIIVALAAAIICDWAKKRRLRRMAKKSAWD